MINYTSWKDMTVRLFYLTTTSTYIFLSPDFIIYASR